MLYLMLIHGLHDEIFWQIIVITADVWRIPLKFFDLSKLNQKYDDTWQCCGSLKNNVKIYSKTNMQKISICLINFLFQVHLLAEVGKDFAEGPKSFVKWRCLIFFYYYLQSFRFRPVLWHSAAGRYTAFQMPLGTWYLRRSKYVESCILPVPNSPALIWRCYRRG